MSAAQIFLRKVKLLAAAESVILAETYRREVAVYHREFTIDSIFHRCRKLKIPSWFE